MAAQRGQRVAGLVIGSLGLGVLIVAATRRRDTVAAPSAAPTEHPAPSILAAEAPRSSSPSPIEQLDRDIVRILDRSLPGSAASYDLLRQWLPRDPVGVAETARLYQRAYAAWLSEQVRLGRIEASRAQDAQRILGGLNIAGQLTAAAAQVGGAALNAAAGVPGIGAVIKGVYDIVQQFVQAAAAAAAAGKGLFDSGVVPGGEPIFTGFKDGAYYFWDIPVWSFTAPMWITEFKLAGGGSAPPAVFAAFERLATSKPFGLPVPRVRIENSGGYSYEFNIKGDGDVSPAAVGRREVRSFEVWNPADITPTGPRGFDPANPWDWKVPGARSSVFDPIYSATGGL